MLGGRVFIYPHSTLSLFQQTAQEIAGCGHGQTQQALVAAEDFIEGQDNLINFFPAHDQGRLKANDVGVVEGVSGDDAISILELSRDQRSEILMGQPSNGSPRQFIEGPFLQLFKFQSDEEPFAPDFADDRMALM